MLKITKNTAINEDDLNGYKLLYHNDAYVHLFSFCPDTKVQYEYLFLEPVEIIKINQLDQKTLDDIQEKYFNKLCNITFPENIPLAYLSLSYESFNFVEQIPRNISENNDPDLCLVLYSKIIQIKPEIIEYNLDWGTPSLWQTSQFSEQESIDYKIDLKPEFTENAYLEKVHKIRKLIYDGEVYQLNLTQRYRAIFKGEPYSLFQKIQSYNESKYACYANLADTKVICNSPELFIDKNNNTLTTSPIKGTIKRSANLEEDLKLKKELLESVKNNAELAMIVDLERNDLGKIAKLGSVKVINPVRVESLSAIHHLVADIQANVTSNFSDILKNIFPSGSITGAPKIAAMQNISEYEKSPRSIYTGSIGYIGTNNSFRLNVAIRTATVRDQVLTLGSGGGIVYDSIPELELHEMELKIKTFKDILKQDLN